MLIAIKIEGLTLLQKNPFICLCPAGRDCTFEVGRQSRVGALEVPPPIDSPCMDKKFLIFLFFLAYMQNFLYLCRKISTIMEQKVKLQIKHGRCHWTVYTRGEWEYDEPIEQDYKLGDQLKMFGFYDYRITEITDNHIVIEFNDDKRILTHEKPVYIITEIEGREWSDGCVYDGEDYSTEISWL